MKREEKRNGPERLKREEKRNGTETGSFFDAYIHCIIISLLLYKCTCIGLDDLQEVKTEVLDIASCWHDFAIALGLRHPLVEQIKVDNPGMYIVQCISYVYYVCTYIKSSL